MLKLIESDKGTIIGNIIKTKKAMDYFRDEIEPNLPKMEKWESKEYKAVFNSHNHGKIAIHRSTKTI